MRITSTILFVFFLLGPALCTFNFAPLEFHVSRCFRSATEKVFRNIKKTENAVQELNKPLAIKSKQKQESNKRSCGGERPSSYTKINPPSKVRKRNILWSVLLKTRAKRKTQDSGDFSPLVLWKQWCSILALRC